MSEAWQDNITQLMEEVGASKAPWAMALLKTAQSKNITASEWNTILEKLAEMATTIETFKEVVNVIASQTIPTVVDGTGDSTTAAMSQKASTESFVPKVSTARGEAYVYAVDVNGNQVLIKVKLDNFDPSSIVQRTSTGEIICATPTADNRAATKKYVDTGLAGKLDSIPYTPTTNVVPTVQQRTGEQNWAQLTSTTPSAWSVCQRDGSGNTAVGTPTAENHATPRSYVDAVYRHDITFEGGFDYNGTTGYMACTVYSRSNTAWDYSGYDCILTSRTTATGVINIGGTTHTIVGLAKGKGGVSYFIYYAKSDGTVERFDFYDGEGTFTDTVNQMV